MEMMIVLLFHGCTCGESLNERYVHNLCVEKKNEEKSLDDLPQGDWLILTMCSVAFIWLV